MSDFTCKFNKNFCVDCMEQNKCSKCGWNPEVKKERINEWKRQKRKEIKGY